MSVLIRGLSKPENCFSCPFFDVYSPSRSSGDEDYQCDLFVSLDYWQAAGKADKACPLVEISTPHGRLIDADALQLEAYNMMFRGHADDRDVAFVNFNLEKAPTIIESETGDK